MSAQNRASSAKTSKEQRRAEELYFDRLKQRALCKREKPCGQDMRKWVERIKHRKPVPTVLDDRGNASAGSSGKNKHQVMKRNAQKTCMTIWKAVIRLRTMLRNAFAIWAQRAQGLLFVTSRTLLCYAPIEPTSQGMLVSTMEEVD